jgi:hypothetical protein
MDFLYQMGLSTCDWVGDFGFDRCIWQGKLMNGAGKIYGDQH